MASLDGRQNWPASGTQGQRCSPELGNLILFSMSEPEPWATEVAVLLDTLRMLGISHSRSPKIPFFGSGFTHAPSQCLSHPPSFSLFLSSVTSGMFRLEPSFLFSLLEWGRTDQRPFSLMPFPILRPILTLFELSRAAILPIISLLGGHVQL